MPPLQLVYYAARTIRSPAILGATLIINSGEYLPLYMFIRTFSLAQILDCSRLKNQCRDLRKPRDHYQVVIRTI